MSREVHRMGLAGVLLFLTACSTTRTPEQSAYLQSASSTPLKFTVEKAKAPELMGKAQAFIQLYTRNSLSKATDFVVSSYAGERDVFSYSVVREDVGETSTITVSCGASSLFHLSNAVHNCHLFSYYLQTGEVRREFMR